jgi:hypothetical protein
MLSKQHYKTFKATNMKTSFQKTQPGIVLMYVLLFTTATGAFNSMACELSPAKASGRNTEPKETTVVPVVKKVQMPTMNPLQVFTSKFM